MGSNFVPPGWLFPENNVSQNKPNLELHNYSLVTFAGVLLRGASESSMHICPPSYFGLLSRPESKFLQT